MKLLGLVIMMAAVVEGIVEYGQTIYDMIEVADYKKAVKQGCAIVLGITSAFVIPLTALSWLLADLFPGIVINPVFDMIITGIVISRGSNIAADFMRLLIQKGKEAPMDFDGILYDDEEDEDETDEDEEA